MSDLVPVNPASLTPAQFAQVADVPPEREWLANITNAKTRRAYKIDEMGVLQPARLFS
jgi:hypothetical protein